MGRFSIGSDDFVDFKEKSACFVDKSLFIKEIIDDTNKVLLITRPRRFGKTLNMSMLNSYLAYNKNDYSSLYEDLNIWKAGEKYREYFQNTPSVFFTMKNVSCDNWNLCYRMLASMLSELISQFKYLKDTLTEEDKIKFDNILFRRLEYEDDLQSSLQLLSKWLYEYHGKKIYIIIDEYDNPIHEGYQHGYYEKIISFMQVFFGSAMKTNPYLDKAILTGITRIAGESLFSKLNSFVSYNIKAAGLNTLFGFTEQETQTIIEKFAPTRKMEDIKRMYNGYQIGGISLYNPWSIMNVLDSEGWGPLLPYWKNTSSDRLLRRQFAIKNQGVKEAMVELVAGKSISRKIKDDVTYLDLEDTGDAVWSFLLYSGYLTLAKMEMNQDKTYELTIPNEEVREFVERIIEGWFIEGLSTNDADMMFGALLTGEVESFQDQFSYHVENSFSYFDTTKTRPELMYHSFILGMLVFLQRDYYCESNAVVGKGRSDILICPKAGTFKDVAVILEFKKTSDRDKLEQVTDDALAQIKTKNYIDGAVKRGCKNIYCYGIGFFKEELMVKMEKVCETRRLFEIISKE
jgi:hypothetical protein